MNQFVNHLSCTALLVGKKASVDGSTMIARNEDAAGGINPKRFIVVKPDEQPQRYVSTFNGFQLDLPQNPLQYTCTPVADTSDGTWGEAGINSENVAMSATETEFTNTTMLGLDPLEPDGIGEEAMLTVVLPYIHNAREGVQRLGELLTKYGTCESNGIAFSDADEVWYFETVGGHHWAAERIPDDRYVLAPNQTGIQEMVLSSHYQATEFDPYGQTGTAETRHRYRPIGMNRNQEMHILQIRPNMPKAHAAIHWLAEGVNIFNSPVPFFANCTTTPENFQYTPTDKSSTDSFYWLNKLIAMVADPLFAEHNWDAEVAVSESRKFGFAAGRAAVAKGDAEFADVKPEDLPAWHDELNAETAATITNDLQYLLHQLVCIRAEKMTPTFEKGGEL